MTESSNAFITTNIYHHNNIMAKSWILIFAMTILKLKTSKTQITTNVRALIHLGLHGSVTEWIKHEATGMLTYHEKSSYPVRSKFIIV